jgi:type IV secretory pathway TrbL component
MEMSATLKKILGLAAAAVLASTLLMIGGCSSNSSGSTASTSTASSAASSSASSEASSSSSAGIANPWQDAASAEEAAAGAGIDAFPLPEGEIADLGKPFDITYRYMNGMAEARYEFGASAITVRTAKLAEGESFDISGDYNTYAHEWTENIANLPIACAGNREGESTKTYWGNDNGDVAHSLVAEGLGGDTDFGLNTERLTVFVEAMA